MPFSKQRVMAFVLWVAWTLHTIGLATAQEDADKSEVRLRFGLLIGNDDYGESGSYKAVPDIGRLHDLRNSCNDVMAVAGKLQRIGWKEEDIDWNCNLTKSQIDEKIERFIARLQD